MDLTKIKAEFEEKFGGIRKIDCYEDKYTYQNMTDKTQEVWQWIENMVKEIEREAVMGFVKYYQEVKHIAPEDMAATVYLKQQVTTLEEE